MVDTRKLGDGTTAPENDFPVVVPDNMGKGLAWNADTKKYDVNAKDANGVKVNADGSVGLAVSADEGNLIELRDNGVYYGTKAAQTDFYVDSNNGNDTSGDGTRENPFRTLHRALQDLKPQYAYTIHLEENGSYLWQSSVYQLGVSLEITPYGAVFETRQQLLAQDGFGVDYAAMSEGILRPTLTFVSDRRHFEASISQSVARQINLASGQKLLLRALNLVVQDAVEPLSQDNKSVIDTQGNEIGNVTTMGCTLNTSSNVYFVANVKTQMHYNLVINGSGKGIWLSSYFLNNINFVFDGGNGAAIGTKGVKYRVGSSYADLVAKVDNKLGVLTANVQTNTAAFSS